MLDKIKRLRLILAGIGLILGLGFGLGLGSWPLLPPAPEVAPAFAYKNLIRFHVVANSDTPADQALKMQVRNRILAELEPVLSQATSVEQARHLVAENLPQIESAARDTLRQKGGDYPLQAQFGQFAFPAKSYGDVVLPSGTYTALRVLIGQGAGQNWWCVLYPPLCFVDCTGGGPALVNPQWDEDSELSSPVLAPKSEDPAKPDEPAESDAEPVFNFQPEIRFRVLNILSE